MKIIIATISFCSLFFIGFNNPNQLKNSGTGFYSDTTKIRGKPFYSYPDEVVTDTARKRFEKEFKKGKVLYEINCAGCHNTKQNNKLEIPDFSLPQLMDYEIRFQYPAHEEDMKETNISHDELDLVVQYLRYKKKSGIPYRPK